MKWAFWVVFQVVDWANIFTPYAIDIDWTACWTMVVALATISLVAIAWFQLSKMSKVARADFLHRFKNDFFKERTRNLFDLFDNEIITFAKDTSPNRQDLVFFIAQSNSPNKSLPRTVIEKHDEIHSTSEIDDLLLGHFEDMWLFHRQGLMDIESIYESFDYHIELIHDNEQIQKYIQWSRSQPNGKDFYDGFDRIYARVVKYREAKERKRQKQAGGRY